LDVGAVDALIDAIKAYKGGILIVSHDQHLINETCDQIWYIKNKRLLKFNGDFDKYR
jgi:ATP-binding cassette subfamily F protein 3